VAFVSPGAWRRNRCSIVCTGYASVIVIRVRCAMLIVAYDPIVLYSQTVYQYSTAARSTHLLVSGLHGPSVLIYNNFNALGTTM